MDFFLIAIIPLSLIMSCSFSTKSNVMGISSKVTKNCLRLNKNVNNINNEANTSLKLLEI